MSVVSKIFIVINLALTLLLVAAIATQINLKGLYKERYKEHHEGWRTVKDDLGRTKTNYIDQLDALRKRAQTLTGARDEAAGKRDKLKSTLQARQSEVGRLDRAGSTLESEIRTHNSSLESTEGEIRRARDDLASARKETEQAINRTRRAINTAYSVKAQVEDSRRKLESLERTNP